MYRFITRNVLSMLSCCYLSLADKPSLVSDMIFRNPTASPTAGAGCRAAALVVGYARRSVRYEESSPRIREGRPRFARYVCIEWDR